jgi:sortase A
MGRRSKWLHAAGARVIAREVFGGLGAAVARTSNTGKTNIAAWTALLLLVLGSVLVGLFIAARLLLSLERDQGIEAFDAARHRRAEASNHAEPHAGHALSRANPAAEATAAPAPEPGAALALRAAPPDQSLWSRVRIAAYRESQTAQDTGPEGVLRIPAVGIEVPVYEGTSEINLNRGAGRVEWTPPLGPAGNVGIAAHRDGFFRPLKDVAAGDEVIVDLLDSTLRYKVVDIRIVEPDDIAVLTPTEHANVTLITCYPFYFVGSAPQRFIIRAELADVIHSVE